MSTKVSICSNASLMLGQDEIQSLDPPDETTQAKLAANLYPMVRQYVLRKHPWNACVKRVTLAPDADTPDFDYAYQFSMPADWLKTIQVGERGVPVDYQQEGRKFLCDEAVFRLVYIFDNENEATFDSMLAYILTLCMKAVMAYPMTKSQSVANAAVEEAIREMRSATAVDGQDNPPETFGDFRLLAARYGGTTRTW